MKINLDTIAASCHELNRALCEANGDMSQPSWAAAPEWQRRSAINGVALHVTDPNMSPAASHESWLAQKTREGWKYGKVKDVEKKTHPNFLPYAELPAADKVKDYIFKQNVANMRPMLGANEIDHAKTIAAAFIAMAAADAVVAAGEAAAAANPTPSDTSNSTTSAEPSADSSASAISTDAASQDGDRSSREPAMTDESDAAVLEDAAHDDETHPATDSASTAAEPQPVAEMADSE